MVPRYARSAWDPSGSSLSLQLVSCVSRLRRPSNMTVTASTEVITQTNKRKCDILTSPHLSLDLSDRRGAGLADIETTSLHSSLLWAMDVLVARDCPVQSFIFCTQFFFGLPRYFLPFVAPCSIVFAIEFALVTCPNHLSFRSINNL